METVNEHECEFRFGDHGPKYLMRGPKFEWGVIVLQPSQELGATKDDFGSIIAAAMKSGSTAHNPRPVTEADLRELLQQML